MRSILLVGRSGDTPTSMFLKSRKFESRKFAAKPGLIRQNAARDDLTLDPRATRPRAPSRRPVPTERHREKSPSALFAARVGARGTATRSGRDDPADARGRFQGRSGTKAGARVSGPPSRRKTRERRARARARATFAWVGPTLAASCLRFSGGVTGAGVSFAR